MKEELHEIIDIVEELAAEAEKKKTGEIPLPSWLDWNLE